MNRKLFNHIAPKLSPREWEMIKHIPAGGNWQNIPDTIPSLRLEQIRRSGGRTTYYGRLRYDKPSFTITTYFNRLGNGCNLHPEQDRIISIREGARLQSFPDNYQFWGSKASQYKQIGNAVPPLLARAVAEAIKPYLMNRNFVDLFAGAGGMSQGFSMAGFDLVCANEIDPNYFKTFIQNHRHDKAEDKFILGDVTQDAIKQKVIQAAKSVKKVGVVIGGPPCQGFSHAGWRDPNDKRNQLFKDFVEIVDQVKPEMFILENVPGILTMRKGEAAKEIMDSFTNIGYNVYSPFRLSAEVYGVPQKRKRVFIVGSLINHQITSPQPLFSVTDLNLPTPITVQEAIGGLPPLVTGTGENEISSDYQAVSIFERLMTNAITFDDFYKLQLSEFNQKHKLPLALSNVC